MLSIFFSFVRRTISTPEDYEKFKNGELAEYEYIHIEAGAHPHILSQIALFVENYNHTTISFSDEHGSLVTLETLPKTRKVAASFRGGEHLAQYLPNNYRDYEVKYNESATLTDEEIKVICTWKHAVNLRLGELNLDSGELFERIRCMQNLTSVDFLDVGVTSADYRVEVYPFLTVLPKARFVYFHHSPSLSGDQVRTFLDTQKRFMLPYWGAPIYWGAHWFKLMYEFGY